MRQRWPATLTRVRSGTGRGCSSVGRRAHRWCRCGGSANDARRCRCRLRPAAETRPTSTAVGRGRRHRRSVSARRVGGSARAARRRESGRRGWVRAGWPRWPSHTPGRDCGPRPVVAGRRRRPRRRPPTPREPRRARRGRSASSPGWAWSRNPVFHWDSRIRQRSESSAHDSGTYRARSISACPRGAA